MSFILAAQLQLPLARVAIRRQRTRWGSCSTRGTISLNCCLLFQSPEVVRYLMVHELAHALVRSERREGSRATGLISLTVQGRGSAG